MSSSINNNHHQHVVMKDASTSPPLPPPTHSTTIQSSASSDISSSSQSASSIIDCHSHIKIKHLHTSTNNTSNNNTTTNYTSNNNNHKVKITAYSHIEAVESTSLSNEFITEIDEKATFETILNSNDLKNVRDIVGPLSIRQNNKPQQVPSTASTQQIGFREDKRIRQGRLLLVSLLENFCDLYDQSPTRNRKLFFALCKQLSSMGIIETQDFIDELSSVRNAYKRAFKDLLNEAMQSIQEEKNRKLLGFAGQNPMAPSSPKNDMSDQMDKMNIYSSSFDSLISTSPAASFKSFSNILGDIHPSRFRDEFFVIEKLGRGGFGTVWRTQNKLDSVEYAIKCVRLRQWKKNNFVKILREVKFQARMAHPHVVRYYASWLDQESPSSFAMNKNDASLDDSYVTESSSAMYNTQTDQFTLSMGLKSNHSFEEYSDTEESYSDVAKPPQKFAPNHCSNTGDFGAPTSNAFKPSNVSRKESDTSNEISLCIQMELCQYTLQQWINSRNLQYDVKRTNQQRRSLEALAIFKQITEGLNYIHTRKCIHRDIKPSNIYWKMLEELEDDEEAKSADILLLVENKMGTWKIGDFGLVADDITIVEDDDELNRAPVLYDANIYQQPRTSKVGTALYASPEQLSPKNSPVYTFKSDIYSLGILLFELLQPFSTGMERVEALKQVRLGILPEDFVRNFPKEATLVLWLISENPTERPTARDILSFELVASLDSEVQKYKDAATGTFPLSDSKSLVNTSPVIGSGVDMGLTSSARSSGIDMARTSSNLSQQISESRKQQQQHYLNSPTKENVLTYICNTRNCRCCEQWKKRTMELSKRIVELEAELKKHQRQSLVLVAGTHSGGSTSAASNTPLQSASDQNSMNSLKNL